MRLRNVVLGSIVPALVLCQTAQAQVSLPFRDPFPSYYTNNGTVSTVNGITDVGQSAVLGPMSGSWTIGGGNGNGVPTNHPGAAMTIPGLADDGGIGLFIPSTTSGNRNRGVNFQAVSSGSVYASFLLDTLVNPTANRQLAFLTSDLTQTAGSGVNGIILNSSDQLLLSKNSSSTPTSLASAVLNNGANLVVVRYTFNPGVGDDEFALWLNPDSSTFGQWTAPTPDISTTTGNDSGDLEYFMIQQRNNASSAGLAWMFDNPKLATSWYDVTVVPEPTTFVLAGLAALGLVCYRRSRR